MDNGPQVIHWIGRKTLDHAKLQAMPNLRPVLIREGVLGNTRALLVSPQHGLLIGRQNDRLIRAKQLAEARKGVRIAHGKRRVTHFHLLLDAHQIIFAENAASERLFPGVTAIGAMDEAVRVELFDLFGELRSAACN